MRPFSARLLACLAAAISFVSPARAEFPERPITLVIPFAAGGSTDLVGRLVAEEMSKNLGQQVIVDNRGGAGGNLGAGYVAKAEPDGYTILMGTVATHALNPAVYTKMPYDAVKDFAPISLLVTVPNVMAVHPSVPANNVKELIDLIKADPGKYSYASSGNGTPLHLSGELFKTMAGLPQLVHVPYKGSGPALVDVLGGQVPIIFDNLPSSTEHIKSGKLKGLAVTSPERAPAFPDLPAMNETLPGYETYTWNALFAPAGTPPEVVKKLNEAANAAVQKPEVKAKLAEFSATVVASTPEELGKHVEAELAKWAPIVKEAGAKID